MKQSVLLSLLFLPHATHAMAPPDLQEPLVKPPDRLSRNSSTSSFHTASSRNSLGSYEPPLSFLSDLEDDPLNASDATLSSMLASLPAQGAQLAQAIDDHLAQTMQQPSTHFSCPPDDNSIIFAQHQPRNKKNRWQQRKATLLRLLCLPLQECLKSSEKDEHGPIYVEMSSLPNH